MQVYKRQQQQRGGFEQSNTVQNINTERLQTLGMRIRQSISNGYKLPESDSYMNTSSPSYMNNYEQQQMLNNSKRVPLPSHIVKDGPPALDYNGSTASSLSCWEDEINQRANHSINNFQTLNNDNYNYSSNLKRGIAEVDGKEMQINDYVQRYGPLTFNEEF